MLSNKNILLISPEPWDHIFVSKHHYAVQLARRGNRVFFLNPPGSRETIAATQFENVFQVNYSGFPVGLRFYPSVIRRRIIASAYKALQEICAVAFDVVWSFDNSVFYDLSFLPLSVLKFSHIVDFNQDFQTQMAASTADYCFCTTESIKSNLSRYNHKVYKINHGCPIPLPEMRIKSSTDISRRKALYAGNLSIPYIDWVLLSRVVETNPDVDFIFVGPGANELRGSLPLRSAKNMVLQSANAFFLGAVPASELQDHYGSADILLVAYQEAYQSDQVANPHKIMEYLGSGNVVVATPTHEYLNHYPLVVMSERNSEWPEVFKNVARNLKFYNSADLRSKRRRFALSNSYSEQIARIEGIIS